MNFGGFDLSFANILSGLFTGFLYGLLSIGLVLVYRASRFINFAHVAIGIFAASIFGAIVAKQGLPYWLMLPVAMAVAGAVGGTAEVVAIRRLRSAPSLMSVVATLGIGQLLLGHLP